MITGILFAIAYLWLLFLSLYIHDINKRLR